MTMYTPGLLVLTGFVNDPLDERHIRPDIRLALDRWGDGSHPYTGDFLRAVLENDLKMAVSRADAYNILTLPAIVAYIYNKIPMAAQGSPEIVAAWATEHRQRIGHTAAL